MRIVNVHENAARRAIIESGLREAGYDDIVRLSEKAALRKRLEALEPDVALIDLANPNRDSLEPDDGAQSLRRSAGRMSVTQPSATPSYNCLAIGPRGHRLPHNRHRGEP